MCGLVADPAQTRRIVDHPACQDVCAWLMAILRSRPGDVHEIQTHVGKA